MKPEGAVDAEKASTSKKPFWVRNAASVRATAVRRHTPALRAALPSVRAGVLAGLGPGTAGWAAGADRSAVRASRSAGAGRAAGRRSGERRVGEEGRSR